MMPMPKEDISVGGASGQRAAPAALRADFDKVAPDFAKPRASHECAPVPVCPAAAVSNRTVPGMQYRVAPRSVAALFVRTDDRSGPVIELKPTPA
jgi:hypothetical protein